MLPTHTITYKSFLFLFLRGYYFVPASILIIKLFYENIHTRRQFGREVETSLFYFEISTNTKIYYFQSHIASI